MRTRNFFSVAATLVALAAFGPNLNAQGATSVCKDGTTSSASGKGACSGHGGVDSKATAAAKSAAKAAKADAKKADAKTAAKADTKTAAKGAAQVTCTDGTTSKGGQGACSGHGGIARSRPPAATAAPTLPPAVPPTSPARTRSEAKSKAPETKTASKRGEDNDPTDAIAQCKDGLYSHAANRRGACSRHGGVAKFLKP